MKQIEQNTPYKGNDDELLVLKEKAAELLYKINSSTPNQRDKIHQDLFPNFSRSWGKTAGLSFP